VKIKLTKQEKNANIRYFERGRNDPQTVGGKLRFASNIYEADASVIGASNSTSSDQCSYALLS